MALEKRWQTIGYKYGLSREGFESLVNTQKGNCPVCGEPIDFSIKGSSGAHVDHDHETGEVRGILHNTCNALLGLAGDSPYTLRRAATYLESYRNEVFKYSNKRDLK